MERASSINRAGSAKAREVSSAFICGELSAVTGLTSP